MPSNKNSVSKTRGSIIQGILCLTPNDVRNLEEDFVLVDTRPDYERAVKCFCVAREVHLPRDRFRNEYMQLPREQFYILADEVGLYTRELASFLQSNNYPRVASLSGGFVDWEREGYPVRKNRDELMTGSCMCTLKPKKRFGKMH
ncbi:MAG TPA: hypothetical protein P5531_01300 [Bacteroidales bacterium]|nr:hypothetical protein [Bacteroidales bacterium]HSA42290.1 hypothetical protein [Bacteroidales bacterium]